MDACGARRKYDVRWKVSRQIVFSWIIPGSAIMELDFHISNRSVCLIFIQAEIF